MASSGIIEEQNKKVLNKYTDYLEVNYDDLTAMAEDLSPEEREQAFGIFKEKQLALDPYEQILNADEVKEVFEVFYPKLQELAAELL